MTDHSRHRFVGTASLALAFALSASALAQGLPAPPPRGGDYIVAIVNKELVTAGEIQQRMARVREDARRGGQRLPPEAELRRQILEALIEERVLVTYARDSGHRVDEVELDRAVTNVAAQNQLTVPQLRERLRREGIDYDRFRNQVRDHILVERVREREVQARTRVSDAEIDAFLEKQRGKQPTEYNIAQILITVPEGASEAAVSERRAIAEGAQARVRAGEAFDKVARELSQDGNRERGGEIGLKAANRLPDVFVTQVGALKDGEVAPALLRSAAGFHLLKLLERRDGGVTRVTQTRPRHILLRASAQVTQEAAIARLAQFKQQIESGARTFDVLARESSEDGSAAQGGDLGWVSPGSLVPEFEEAMNALPEKGISAPVVSRFGTHLIQVQERRTVVLEPRQLREQARNVLREQKFEDAYNEWTRELRARAYVEMREPPQ
jgi:peptidyl-prolyl cis-trans isomerase SurA